MAHPVTLIPGDGTGPELAEATRRVLEATGVEFEWDVQHAGTDVMDQNDGNPLPEHVLESIRRSGTALKGPITTPVGKGFRSVNVGLRKSLDLYGQIRPCKSYAGVRSRYERRRPDRRAREHRGPLRRRRVRGGHRGRGRAARLARLQGLRQDSPRLRHLDQADLRDRHAPDRPVRLRLRAPQRPPQGHGRPQGEHHEVHRRALAPVAQDVAAENADIEFDDRIVDNLSHAARPAAGGVRRARAAEPLRRHRLRPLRRPDRGARSRAGRQLRRGRGCLRADSRLGAQVRGPEQGQPDGDDALRDADAAPPRRDRRRRSGSSARSPR